MLGRYYSKGYREEDGTAFVGRVQEERPLDLVPVRHAGWLLGFSGKGAEVFGANRIAAGNAFDAEIQCTVWCQGYTYIRYHRVPCCSYKTPDKPPTHEAVRKSRIAQKGNKMYSSTHLEPYQHGGVQSPPAVPHGAQSHRLHLQYVST